MYRPFCWALVLSYPFVELVSGTLQIWWFNTPFHRWYLWQPPFAATFRCCPRLKSRKVGRVVKSLRETHLWLLHLVPMPQPFETYAPPPGCLPYTPGSLADYLILPGYVLWGVPSVRIWRRVAADCDCATTQLAGILMLVFGRAYTYVCLWRPSNGLDARYRLTRMCVVGAVGGHVGDAAVRPWLRIIWHHYWTLYNNKDTTVAAILWWYPSSCVAN